MKYLIIVLMAMSLSVCTTHQQSTSNLVQGVPDPNKVQARVGTIKDSVSVPQLPEVKEEVREPEILSLEDKLRRLFVDCIIEIKMHDVSGTDRIHDTDLDADKYPDGSSITIVALWDEDVHERCSLIYMRGGNRNDGGKYKALYRIVHEEEGMISLDFMIFEVRRDSFGYDNLLLQITGPSIKKVTADKINWNRDHEVNFGNIQKISRAYFSSFFPAIHQEMKEIVFKRWEEKAEK